MTLGILVLPDQLSLRQAALVAMEARFGAAEARRRCRLLLVESSGALERLALHRQRLVLLWSAQRHVALELAEAGWTVDHRPTDSFAVALQQWCGEHRIEELHAMEPADRPVRQAIERCLARWPQAEPPAAAPPPGRSPRPDPSPGPTAPPSPAPALIWHPSNAFLWSPAAFADWARGRRQLRMEHFYREGRRRFGVLMEGSGSAATPLGGQWNYDHDNRRPPVRGLKGPPPLWFEPDRITRAVIERVEAIGAQRAAAGLEPLPGALEPFGWAVTRQQAGQVLEHFIATRLHGFGPYQDAMVSGQPTLWHSLLSPYINLGLLEPLAVIRRLEQAGRQSWSGPSPSAEPQGGDEPQGDDGPQGDGPQGDEPQGGTAAPAKPPNGEPAAIPLASLEGVIRQILGWREYTFGLYHWLGPTYPASNHFAAQRPLPPWLQDLGRSGMACMDTVLAELRANGYAHHIQRLMVLANYGLIAGLDPQALTQWFQRQFIDGHDWVMQTNVIGMGLFADGGVLASKPYAASGNYINRMSTYCKGCRYDVKQRQGPRACPYNSLYWDFLARHRDLLRTNPRMALVIKQLDRLEPAELAAIRASAAAHLAEPITAAAEKSEANPLA
jgi:deoxyribodipyrimidine photolyase-related protein